MKPRHFVIGTYLLIELTLVAIVYCGVCTRNYPSVVSTMLLSAATILGFTFVVPATWVYIVFLLDLMDKDKK